MISFPWPFFGDDWFTFFIFLFIVLVIIGISESIKFYFFLQNEHIRKIVHVVVGVLCSISPNLFQSNIQPIILGFIFLILNFIALKTNKFKAMHSLDRASYGTIYFPISYIILTSFFWEFPNYITISLVLLSVADPLASLVGQNISNSYYIYPWYDKKSIQGTTTMFLSSFTIVYILAPNIFPYEDQNIFKFSFFLASLTTLAELISHKGSDNLSIPVLSFIGIHCYRTTLINFELIMIVIIIFFLIAYYFQFVDFSGLCGGCIMGLIITSMGGLKYLIPLCSFFILSSLIGKIIGLSQNVYSKNPKRNIVQVLANGLVSLIICVVGFFTKNDGVLYFLFLSSVSAANSDTWATEIGKLSKTKPVSIINFKITEAGFSGGITAIGTLGSFLGSITIGSIGYLLGVDVTIFIGIVITGFLGALVDSILGATLQAKYTNLDGKMSEIALENYEHTSGVKWMGNNFVNFICTLSAPLLMYLFLLCFYFS